MQLKKKLKYRQKNVLEFYHYEYASDYLLLLLCHQKEKYLFFDSGLANNVCGKIGHFALRSEFIISNYNVKQRLLIILYSSLDWTTLKILR